VAAVISVDRLPLPLLRPAFADLEGLYAPWRAASVREARLVVLNESLAAELGLDVEDLQSPPGVAALVGQNVPEGTTTVAQAYAGHQFGGFSSSLGDGRALLLGELIDREGRRRDVHLKGSGPTPFSRGGDGRAVLGPMLREHLIGEAMHALGVPTTRALAVVATGDTVAREALLPGAVLVRVASSHIRVGTFQYVAARNDVPLLRRLADHAIARHHPVAAGAPHPHVALLEAVVDAQAALLARWMLVGFVHGVMNTDNMTISGETIDYGPCAFMDAYDPATVFSSIDHAGRYAYGNQPLIAQWNLARLAEAMLPLFDGDVESPAESANGVLRTFSERYDGYWLDGMRAKLGLAAPSPQDGDLAQELLRLLEAGRADMTAAFRALSSAARGDDAAIRRLLPDHGAFDRWAARWRTRLAENDRPPVETAAAMDRVNPVYIPRNHIVEAALSAATGGDLAPYERVLEVVTHPFDARPGFDAYAEPGPTDGAPHRTFCGT
jgi:uncharacterized protein YdiU (UPF0061 family)